LVWGGRNAGALVLAAKTAHGREDVDEYGDVAIDRMNEVSDDVMHRGLILRKQPLR
jgi:hypothetical protein